jgi:hypothetical protein
MKNIWLCLSYCVPAWSDVVKRLIIQSHICLWFSYYAVIIWNSVASKYCISSEWRTGILYRWKQYFLTWCIWQHWLVASLPGSRLFLQSVARRDPSCHASCNIHEHGALFRSDSSAGSKPISVSSVTKLCNIYWGMYWPSFVFIGNL